MNKLRDLWKRQKKYNETVRATESPEDFEYWMKQYLLGAVAEVDEILQELSWKRHRRGKPLNRNNLARELADLTKFVWCMWEWSGYDEHQMLEFVEDKTNELDQQWKQDFEFVIPSNSNVIITDLDGTVGNWRAAFRDWLLENNLAGLPDDDSANLSFEVDMQLPYPTYVQFKEAFEASGGYKKLQPYVDTVKALQHVYLINNVVVIAYTARPARTHTRIWSDTWQWLGDIGLRDVVKELRIGAEDRISRACMLQSEGHRVIMLDDDPGIAIRAASAGIDVCLRAQPYNAGMSHDKIVRVEKYNPLQLMAWFESKKGKE